MRALLLGSIASGVITTAAHAQAGFDLVQLMQGLAQVRSGEAMFTEQRHSTLFEQTLDSSGRLSFAAPDSFVRETLKPRRERLAVAGNQLTLTQGGRTRVIALDATPQAAVVVDAIRGTLSGNRELLERTFKVAVTGTSHAWRLELVPRDFALLAVVRSIGVTGRNALVREVHVLMADGDRSVMTIEPLPAGIRP